MGSIKNAYSIGSVSDKNNENIKTFIDGIGANHVQNSR